MVAADAGLDPSMVMRYYGSKDGLFSAAVDVDLHLPHLVDVPSYELGRVVARHFAELWESDWGHPAHPDQIGRRPPRKPLSDACRRHGAGATALPDRFADRRRELTPTYDQGINQAHG